MATALGLITRHGNLWAIEREFAERAMAELAQIDMHVHFNDLRRADAQAAEEEAAKKPADKSEPRRDFTLVDGTAIFRIDGVMTKRGSSWSDSASTNWTRKQLRAAMADDEVKNAIIVFDTPGGSISGLPDLANDIAALRSMMPVVGYVEDLCCSAGYWAASQTDAIIANAPTADLGSLGVRMVVRDYSRMFENAGVKVIPVDTGEFKSAGEPGTRVTDRQVADWQRLVDQTGDEFVAAIMRGRNMTEPQVRALFTGQVWNATDALKMGLIDGIASFDTVLADLRPGKVGAMGKKRRYTAAATRGEEDEMAEGTSRWEKFKAAIGLGAASDEAEEVAALEDIKQGVAALQSENETLKAENTSLREEAEGNRIAMTAPQLPDAAAVDAWLTDQRAKRHIMPAAADDAKALYGALSQEQGEMLTAFLANQGVIAPFQGETYTKNGAGEEEGSKLSDGLNPQSVYARRAKAAAGKGN